MAGRVLDLERHRIAIDGQGTQSDEGERGRQPERGREPDARVRGRSQDLAEGIAERHDAEPGQQRIGDEPGHPLAPGGAGRGGAEREQPGLRRRARRVRSHRGRAGRQVQHVMAQHDRGTEDADPRGRHAAGHQQPEQDHRQADDPDHLEEHPVQAPGEEQAQPHQRQLQDHQEQPARGQEPGLLARPSLLAQGQHQVGRRPRQEDEHRGAEVGHPAGEEEREGRGGRVGGIDPHVHEEVAGVVQDHEDHDDPAERHRRPPAAPRPSRRASRFGSGSLPDSVTFPAGSRWTVVPRSDQGQAAVSSHRA